MASQIQLRRDSGSNWASVNPTLAEGEVGINTTTDQFKIGNGVNAWNSLPYSSANISLNDIGDVTITDAANGDFLRWNGTAWINDAVNLSTDTVGDYVNTVTASTGLTITGSGGESSSPTFSIGQDVATNASVIFAQVTAPLVGNATTASALETSRIIELSGDVSGSVSFNGSSGVNINTTIQPDSVTLGTDTTGNYLIDLSQGTGVTVSHTPGEGSTASISIGQDVATNASVTFANVSSPLVGNVTGNADTASALQTARTISLSGDLSGSVSFSGSADVSISATIAPDSVALGTDTTGNYLVDLSQGTGVTVTHTPGEGSTASISIGQDVATTSSVSFASITGPLTGNADTASQLQTARTIALGGDLSGSVSFDGSSSVTINATVINSGVSLNELSDVVITTPLIDESLVYDGTNWVNKYANATILGHNGEATTLTVGTVVYIDGATGETPTVMRASSGDEISSTKVAGLVSTAIASGANGPITILGEVFHLALSAYDEGDILWLGSTPGTFTKVKPTAPQHSIYLGVVLRANNGNGIAFIKPQLGFELDELHNVLVTNVANNDFLKWNSSASVWVNDQINLGTDTVGNYVSDVVSGTGISVSHTPGEGSSASISINATLDNLSDTTVGSPSTGDFLKWNGTAWVNDVIDLATDTSGDYVSSLVEGTGVIITNNSGENASPTIAIGQSVATNASVEFYHIAMTGPVDGSNTVATKQYVDQVAAGIDWHESVALGSVAALPNMPTYDNGSSGSGATLTASVSGRLIVDGSNAVTGTRVLVKNQVTATENGIYDVTEQGSASVTWVITRSEDFDGDFGHEIFGGEAVFVTGGTINIRQGFTVTSAGTGVDGAHEFGTDSITFTQFTGTSAFVIGDGLAQNGNEISVGTASTDRIVLSAHAIDLATVAQTNSTGSNGVSFVQSHSVDSYGRITGTISADVQDAGTSQKGIAQFNSNHFTVSSGSVSIGQAVATTSSVTFAAVTAPLIGNVTGDISGNAGTATQLQTARTISLTGDVTGSVSFSGSANAVISAVIAANSVALGTDTTGNYVSGVSQGTGVTVSHTPSEGSTATISIGQDVATSATPTFSTINITNSASVNSGLIRTSVSGSTVSLNMKGPSSMADMFRANYTQAALPGNDTALIALKDSSGVSDVALIRFSQSTSSVGVSVGPRVTINSASAVSSDINPAGSSSVALFLNQSSTSSVGIRIKDSTGVMGPAFQVVASDMSSSSVAVSIAGAIDGYRFFANSASLSSASVQTLTVGGNLVVNGTTTTVNSTTVTIDDPIFTLGGDIAPVSDDNKDRGIEFRYHSGVAASVGFMGYDDSTGRFIFLTGATNSSEVFSGTSGSVDVAAVFINGSQISAANLSNGTTGSGAVLLQTSAGISSATLSGSTGFSGSVGFDSSASVTLPAKTFYPEEYLAVSSSVTVSSATHRYATLEMTASAGTSVVSVPTDLSDNFPIGSVIQIIRVGAGEVQVLAVTPGTTAVNNALGTRLRAQWSTATLRKRAANTWLLSGDLKV